MKDFVLVFMGGGIGASLRFLTSKSVKQMIPSSPWIGTLIVNVIGSLIMISLYKFYSEGSAEIKKFVQVGILGGLTTFSSFSLEVFGLVEKGNLMEALLVLSLNIFFGIIVAIFIFR